MRCCELTVSTLLQSSNCQVSFTPCPLTSLQKERSCLVLGEIGERAREGERIKGGRERGGGKTERGEREGREGERERERGEMEERQRKGERGGDMKEWDKVTALCQNASADFLHVQVLIPHFQAQLHGCVTPSCYRTTWLTHL